MCVCVYQKNWPFTEWPLKRKREREGEGEGEREREREREREEKFIDLGIDMIWI